MHREYLRRKSLPFVIDFSFISKLTYKGQRTRANAIVSIIESL